MFAEGEEKIDDFVVCGQQRVSVIFQIWSIKATNLPETSKNVNTVGAA